MRLSSLRVELKSNKLVFLPRGKFRYRLTEARRRQNQRWGQLLVKECWGLPATTKRAQPCQHLKFGLPALGYERTNFYCFKPPSLWCFVTVALEIYYRVDFVVA